MNNTKHNNDCKRVFKNYDLSCPRCKELAAGSSPRDGWQKSYYENKNNDAEYRSKAIAEHYRDHENTCDYAKRGVPCVAFDW